MSENIKLAGGKSYIGIEPVKPCCHCEVGEPKYLLRLNSLKGRDQVVVLLCEKCKKKYIDAMRWFFMTESGYRRIVSYRPVIILGMAEFEALQAKKTVPMVPLLFRSEEP